MFSSKGRAEAGSTFRTENAQGDNVDVGTKELDGIRVGAVTMAAFVEEEDDDPGTDSEKWSVVPLYFLYGAFV